MKYFYKVGLKLWLAVIVSISFVKASQAQNMEFNTDGLYNAEFFDNIYRGHFEDIELKREDLDFLSIFNQYLRSYGRRCDDYLPADKVPIMDIVCARERIEYNGYGAEINRYCIEWTQDKSGLYARHDLYEAMKKIERIHNAGALRQAMQLIADPNALGNSVDMVHKAKALQFDMARIFELNPCDRPGIRRFEENLKLFALNKPSIRMKGVSKYTAMKRSGGPTGLQDYNRLIDDLVVNQSKTWAFNRYIRGSISGVTFLREDSQGRPTAIKANYQYSGFSGKSNGWVKITFDNGLPNGIYFFDFPNNRKTPSPGVVASYAKGDYGK